MSVPADVEILVRNRAEDRCQYCRMHQSLQGATFHIEHVIPVSAGGASDESNLVLACPSCNLHKSSRTQAVDPESGESVRLFHPLLDSWSEHFEFRQSRLAGLTAIGRGTVQALKLNHPRRLKIREAESMFGLFPPD
ncbi:MAG: HNH endonuclease signature motif containing protein [Verrucomicrobiota bacterium]